MRKALVIGINDYPKAELFGCINDASGVAAVLQTNADGSPNFDVKLKTNVETKAELKKSIKELFKGDSEIALFYFSGHGFANEYGACLVTPDFKEHDEGVSMSEILDIVNDSQAREKIIILDCCHAGKFGTSGTMKKTETTISSGITILTACKETETSLEENGRGVFTNLLISALLGGSASLTGDITPGSVYAYIDQALGAWEQRPVFKTNVTTFTSLRKISPPISHDILRELPKFFANVSSVFNLDPSYEPDSPKPNPEHNTIFAKLQECVKVGLVLPEGAKHMYFAAMNSKGCKLTALGSHYWRLAKNGRI